MALLLLLTYCPSKICGSRGFFEEVGDDVRTREDMNTDTSDDDI